MNFQERFKGKTSQVSKDLVASITDTTDKMKVDFHNMKPCDVFEISRSYTPTVKSEMGGPSRNSKEIIQFNTTDKGIFSKQQKAKSQKLIAHHEVLNTLGNEHHQSIFSNLQNNFDNNDTISDMFSPVNLKKSIVMKQMEKSRFQDSPTVFKGGNPSFSMNDNIPTSPLKLDKSNSVFQPKLSLQSPQQALQARLAKERSQSNNFQRVGSYLAKPSTQQTEPSTKEKGGVEIIVLRNSTPQFTVKKMQTEEGENLIKNLTFIDSNNLQQSKSLVNSSRTKNIEKNLIVSNRSNTKQMTEMGSNNIQMNSEGVMYTYENNERMPSSISPKKLSHTLPLHSQKLSLQVQQQQSEEYYPQNTYSNGVINDMSTSQQLNQMTTSISSRKIKSHINFNDANRKITPNIPDGKQQEDLEQFINGLNGLGRSQHSQSSTFLQSKSNNMNANNSSKILQSQQLWMNNQLAQILPTDSLQNQINQIQLKKEEEDSLTQYKNSFNYKQRKNGKIGMGNDSPALSGQGMDSPSVFYKRQPENFQQMSEEATSSHYPGQAYSLQSTINNNTANSNANTPQHQQLILRQKSYSSQAYPQNLQQRVSMNIK